MKTRVTILASERRDFVNKSGKKSTTFNCQCIVHGDKVEVGVLRCREILVPGYVEGQEPVAPQPGDYFAEYGLAIHWENKELQGVLKLLTPINGHSAADSVKEVLKGEKVKA